MLKKISKVLMGVAAAMVLLLAVMVVATWAPDRSLADLQGRWAPAPSQFLAVAGMQVHVRDEGPRDDPQPIVLIHGTAASLHTWDGWTSLLKAQRRVIRFDLPGFGLTGPSPDADYSIAAYVRFTVAVLDKLGLQRVVLAGNSLGGQVAWETALAQPARVEKLILVDAAGYPFESQSVPIGFRIARIPVLNRVMQYTLARSFVESSVRDVYGDPSRVTPELLDRYFELTLREGNRAALVQRLRQGPVTDASAKRIAQLKLPVLVLWGGRDQLIPPDNAQRFQHDIAGSELIMFDDLGHVPHEEDPLRTVNAIRNFLK
jgi:pimeloyl-ACP methyl ester carboxylesterase